MQSAKEVLLNPRFTQEDLDFAKNTFKEGIQNVPKNSREGLLREMFKGQFYGTTTEEILKTLIIFN